MEDCIFCKIIKGEIPSFKVYEDDKKFGELRLSRGAVVWRGAFDKIGRRMGWKKFDQLMQDEARLAERRPLGARTTVRKKKRRS